MFGALAPPMCLRRPFIYLLRLSALLLLFSCCSSRPMLTLLSSFFVRFALLQINKPRASRYASARRSKKISSEQQAIEVNKMFDCLHLTRSQRSVRSF